MIFPPASKGHNRAQEENHHSYVTVPSLLTAAIGQEVEKPEVLHHPETINLHLELTERMIIWSG